MPNVHIFAYENAVLLDIAGPLQVFRSASLYAAELNQHTVEFYRSKVFSISGGQVRTTVGLTIGTDVAKVAPADIFLIVGGSDDGVAAAQGNSSIVEFIRAQSAVSKHVAAVSTGAFLLAQTGLLNGRRATTHWMDRRKFAAAFPEVNVVADAAYFADGPFWTSAGVLSGADLSLALVEQDLGRRVANFIARVLISDSRRTIGEPQFSARVEARETENGRVRALMEAIADNPYADLSTEVLAESAELSIRSLHRHFVAETGQTPAKFVERARVQTAQRLLASTDDDLSHVAAASGFGSATIMQRAFVRQLGLSAAQFRKGLARYETG